MNTMGKLQIVLGMAMFVLAMAANAGVYKWVDADGNVHFSDQPQPGSKAQAVTLHDSHGVGGGGPAPAAGKEATPAPATPDTKEKAAKAAAAKEEAAKNCDSLNKSLQDMSGKPMVTIADADGNKQTYQGHGMEQAQNRVQSERDKWCAEATK